MASLNKKEPISKVLRMDKRMAKDLELLSEATDRSQNDIIVRAVKQCLFENRKYFVREMIQELFLYPVEHDVVVMKENSYVECGLMTIRFEKTEDADVYSAYMAVQNKHKEIIVEDQREVHVNSKEWEQYKEYIIEQFSHYIDLEEEGLKHYFYERFSYE